MKEKDKGERKTFTYTHEQDTERKKQTDLHLDRKIDKKRQTKGEIDEKNYTQR